jgi:purine-binding chemotaxis protein CheW
MTMLAEPKQFATEVQQFATFYVGNVLLGVNINAVQEINRQLQVTPVPGAPAHVRGVINLRGEVATVIDLRTVLGMPPAEETRLTRNLILHSQAESIGLYVDRISDIQSVYDEEIGPPPSNVRGVDGRFILGVHTLDSEIVVLLDVEKILAHRE